MRGGGLVSNHQKGKEERGERGKNFITFPVALITGTMNKTVITLQAIPPLNDFTQELRHCTPHRRGRLGQVTVRLCSASE